MLIWRLGSCLVSPLNPCYHARALMAMMAVAQFQMLGLLNRISLAGLAALSCALLAAAPVGHAQTADAELNHTPYVERQAVQKFIARMVSEHRFERTPLVSLLSGITPQHKALESLSRPVEKTWEWHEYRRLFVKPERVAAGLDFWRLHYGHLAHAQCRFGIPPEIVLAILGIESRYGQYKGRYPVFDTLVTLAFDAPRRSGFFRKELEHYLLLVREQHFDPTALRGSYAGAMGYGQFISSSYRHYAIDFDGDEVADLFDNPVDAIGSIANYLAENGWRRDDVLVAVPATVDVGADLSLANSSLRPVKTVATLARAGFRSSVDLPPGSKATPLRYQLKEGEEYWLGLHNFHTISTYNPSRLYSMAVLQLAQEIRAARSAEAAGR